ncbi:MAG TPA: ABC transporter permease [Clostridia bacterium]|nr:ABC transporter permease [Clostridia bacterium]
MMAMPSLPLTLVLVAYLGGSMANMIFVICCTAWVGTARVIRARTMQLREAPFVMIARALGASHARIMLAHLLPNVADILLTRFALSVGSAMMTESGLSFLGLGSYGQKSWGNVLHFAFYRGGLMRNFYWWYLPPIICISACMLGFILLGQRGSRREGFARPGKERPSC